MVALSRLIAPAILVVGTALISSISPSTAQAQSTCCTPQQIQIITNASWTVTDPSGKTAPAAIIKTPNSSWRAALGPSDWIANDPNAASNNMPGGLYKYTYTFCLCPLPPGVKGPLQAALTLKVLADNTIYAAKLNITTLAVVGGSGATTPATIIAPANAFVPCNNVLTISVRNYAGSSGGGTPTGFDASGALSGYFQPVPPGAACPCPKPYIGPVNTMNTSVVHPMPLPT